jgi:hypothetical protein
MSGSQGTYDIALSRKTHDIAWDKSTPDEERVIWDDGETLWDVKWADKPIYPKYSIWPINGADKVAQQIKINLLSFLGEWFLDITYGVPYLEDILVKNPRMAVVETIFRHHILDVPHVTRIDALSLDWNRKYRLLGVEFTCSTDYGPITDSVKLEMVPGV